MKECRREKMRMEEKSRINRGQGRIDKAEQAQ